MAKLMRRVHEYTTKSGLKGTIARAKYYEMRTDSKVKRVCLDGGIWHDISDCPEFLYNNGDGYIRMNVSPFKITNTGIPIINLYKNSILFKIENGSVIRGRIGSRILAIQYEKDNRIDIVLPSRVKGNNCDIALVVGQELFDLIADSDLPQMEVHLDRRKEKNTGIFGGVLDAVKPNDIIRFSTRKRDYSLYPTPNMITAFAMVSDHLTLTV